MILKYYTLAKNKLFPLTRSITGEGTRKTLNIIKDEFSGLKIKKIKSGTKIFDWKIPHEWNVSSAYVLDRANNKIINFSENNLHLLGYSKPINKILSKKDLFKNLYYLKKQPDAIPYITSYYKKRWGFCITYNQYKYLNNKYSSSDKFKVVINSSFKKNGFLNYGEIVLKGKSKQEILISTYICHPSMANNELSGPIVSMSLLNHFQNKKLDKTIRFIFIPETIGSLAYLHKNLKQLKNNVIGGYNLTCIGDERMHSCILSKYQNSPSDEALIKAYKVLDIKKYKIFSFLKRGSDERQYNSPGIDLNITSIFRSKYGEYPEYHTSLDDFELVTPAGCTGGYQIAKQSIKILQKRKYPKNKILGEPQLSKRNMYPSLSTKKENKMARNFTNFLQYADGKNSLEKISKIIKVELKLVKKICKILYEKKLIEL